MDYKSVLQILTTLYVLMELLIFRVEARPPLRRLFKLEERYANLNNTLIPLEELNEFVGQVYLSNEDLCSLPNNKNRIVCRSRCKWGYKIDFDARRLPKALVVADRPEQKHECGSGFECEQIWRKVPILTLIGCTDGKCTYGDDHTPIPVAAVCLKKNQNR